MTDFFCSLANTRLVHSCSQFRFILVTVVRITCGGLEGKGAGVARNWRLEVWGQRTRGKFLDTKDVLQLSWRVDGGGRPQRLDPRCFSRQPGCTAQAVSFP